MKKTLMACAICTVLVGMPAHAGIAPGEPCVPGVDQCDYGYKCLDYTHAGFDGYACGPGYQYGEACTPGSGTTECGPGLICYTDEYDQSLCLRDCADESTNVWQQYPPGLDTPYQYRYCTPCGQYGECEWGVRYRCAPNYYGTATADQTGCNTCPPSGSVDGRSDGGATSITGCYIPAGTSGSDETGNFTYAEKCYYSK